MSNKPFEWDEDDSDRNPRQGTCDDCGKERPVIDTICPYQNEINEKQVDITVCKNCHYNRSDEI